MSSTRSPLPAPRNPKGRGAWYMTTIHACPICGTERVYRERRWDPKPEAAADRIDYDNTFACQGHFL